MRVIIKAEGRKFWIPVPMCLGGLGIKYGLKYSTKTQVSKIYAPQIGRSQV